MDFTLLFQNNLESISHSCPQFHDWFRAQPLDIADLQQRLVADGCGHVDFQDVRGRLIRGSEASVEDYGEWAPVAHDGSSATIVLGSGMGHGIQRLLKHTPASHRILLVEPRADLAAVFLSLNDVGKVVSSGRLYLLPPDLDLFRSVLNTLDYNFYHGRIYFRTDPSSLAFDNRYATLSDSIQSLLEGFTLEMSTMRRDQDLVIGNELANFHRAFEDGSVKALQNCAQGASALLMGAGPSLAEVIPTINSMAATTLRTCALQTLPVLQRLDLKPHFCLAVDPKEVLGRTYEHLDPGWAADIPLIYATRVHPKVVRDYPGPTLPLWTHGGIATLAMRGKEPVLHTNGNVNNGLMHLLAWCGVNRIILAGQDFSWPGGSAYSPGHLAYNPRRGFNPKRHVAATNAEGRTVYTSRGLLAARRDMDENIVRLGLKTWNILHKGLPIPNARNIALDDIAAEAPFVCEPEAVQQVLGALDTAHTPCPRPVFEQRHREWSHSLHAVTKRLKKLSKTPGRTRGEARAILEQILLFVRQDPLYAPCLFTEIMDIKGLAGSSKPFSPQAYRNLSGIVQRILQKVEHVDSIVGEKTGLQAA